MKRIVLVTALAFVGIAAAAQATRANRKSMTFLPDAPTFTTLITIPRAIEGLTNDGSDRLYVVGSGAAPCPVWRVDLHNPTLALVGNIPTSLATSCTFRGLAFDHAGNLLVLDTTLGRVYALVPSAASPPNATLFATGVPGANGVAVDRRGAIWISDGSTGLGRVWKIDAAGANCSGASPVISCQEIFRVQPMRNDASLGGNGTTAVGRQARIFPPATVTIAGGTFPLTPPGGQDIVANGLAFDARGDLLIMDTARGALWRAELARDGSLRSSVGCDMMFAPDTLCLENVFLSHPILEGGDGIVLDRAGNIWIDANERNAIAVVTPDGQLSEVFRNPVNASGLRNAADVTADNAHILEFPTSPVLSNHTFCTASSDGDRRDNSPAAAGEINGALGAGKISCLDQKLMIPGVTLPVR